MPKIFDDSVKPKNIFSNGSFRWNQRNAQTFTALPTSFGYMADRWSFQRGGNWTTNISMQTFADNLGVGSGNFFLEEINAYGLMTMGGTAADSTATFSMRQRIESQVMRGSGIPGSGATIVFFLPNQLFNTVTINLRSPTFADSFGSMVLLGTQTLPLTVDSSFTGLHYQSKKVVASFSSLAYTAANGLEVEFVFSSPANIGSNKFMYPTGFMLLPGATVPNEYIWHSPTPAQELNYCQRFFEKSYDHDVLPGTVTDAGRIALHSATAIGAMSNLSWFSHRFQVTKRTTPTVTTYAASAANQPNRFSDASGITRINNVSEIGIHGFSWKHADPSSTSGFFFHFTAEAEL